MADVDKAKVAQLHAMHEALENMHEHLQLLDKQRSELRHVDQGLDELGTVDDGAEVLVQVASGIFAEAKLVKGAPLRVNVGADVMVDRSIEETRKIVQDQIVQLRDVHAKLAGQMAELIAQFEALQEELTDVQVSQG